MSKKEEHNVSGEEMVKRTFEALLESYGNSNHGKKFDLIHKAFDFANEAHKGVKRVDGDPYIMHPLAVAMICSEELGLGSTSICSALLHDVVEDTDYTVEDIRYHFGDKIASIVDGLTKISGGILADATSGKEEKIASIQAENMRKLLLTMSDDIRVVLIKMADRLHNMRTLSSLMPAKQYKIAGETMYLYAPLAHRLGLFKIKTELEDLSFKYEYPEEYRRIQKELDETDKDRSNLYEHFAVPLEKTLDSMGFTYKIQYRLKSVYSIWNKMKNKKIAFKDIYDIFAVRIVFEPKEGIEEDKQCMDIYWELSKRYTLRPERFRNWVTQPKPNGYQSIHLTVMGPDGKWIEVQIRTKKMDDIAEKGLAAHWKYKERKDNAPIQEQAELDEWLARIQEALTAADSNAMDFISSVKMNLYSDEIFVFTPSGEIKTLPQDATALDFAYEIHTNLGDHCIGAKVNHKLVPLSYKLVSGDQIEILTSRSHLPEDNWLNFVTTSRAKTKIEESLKKQKRDLIKKGEKIFNESLENDGVEVTASVVDKVMDSLSYRKKEDMYLAIAKKELKWPDQPSKMLKDNFFSRSLKSLVNLYPKDEKLPVSLKTNQLIDPKKIDKKKTYILSAEDYQAKVFSLATCCSPIPGDDVIGFITADKHLSVHKRDCATAINLKAMAGNTILTCHWEKGNRTFDFPVTMKIVGQDRIGILSDVLKAISVDMSLKIDKVVLESVAAIFEGTITIQVHDVSDITKLSSLLKKISGVDSFKRVD